MSEEQRPVGAALAAAIEYSDIGADDRRGRKLLGGGLDLVKNVVVKIQVMAGHASLSVGELLSLQEGQVLKLDSALDEPLLITLEGQPVASGQLMAVGDHFAVRIVDTVQRESA